MSGGNNGIDLAFRRQNAEYGTSLSMVDDILSLLNRKGDILSSVKIDLIKKEVLPQANEDNLGVIYLYTGSDGEYKHGYFYECVENSGVYSWENIIVQDSYLKSESDNRFVHKTGDETIDGEKTWNEDAHFKKNISAAGDIILENEENIRHINFKVNNDIKALVSNTYISNYPSIGSILTLKSIYDENNSSRIELLSQLNKSEITAYGNFSVIGTGHFYDELTAEDINIQNDKQTKNLIFKNELNEEKAKIQNAILTNRSILRISCSYDDNLKSNITFNANNSTQETSVIVSGSENETASNSTTSSVIATQGWVNNPEKSLNVVHRSGDEEISGRKDFLDDITAPNQLDYTNISNCITEIPQDIKLEIDASYKFIAKAGTKVYFGDGTSTTLSSDINFSASTEFPSKPFLFAVLKFNLTLQQALVETCVSSATNPGTPYIFWFCTEDNKCYWNDDSGVAKEISLPIALVIHTNGTGWTNIDQVFNGFGYIGSTVFALPGVKGRIPNGRNEDGTLKSINWTCNSVVVRTFPTSDNYSAVLGFNGPAFSRLSRSSYSYNQSENYNYNNADVWTYTHIGYIDTTAGVISNFNIKTPFHAVDYNDREFIGHQAMPSNRKVNLTLGASGASYTAPADGYFCLSKQSTGTQWANLINSNTDTRIFSTSQNGNYVYLFVPARKGDTIYSFYTLAGTTEFFRFSYAEGSK